MSLKYIKNQSVREEVGEWLLSSFPCLNCNECSILMSISPEELCRYCGCAANQHVFLIPREEDVSCTESEQETISFEKGSLVYGEDFIEEDLDTLEDSGIMLQVNMSPKIRNTNERKQRRGKSFVKILIYYIWKLLEKLTRFFLFFFGVGFLLAQ